MLRSLRAPHRATFVVSHHDVNKTTTNDVAHDDVMNKNKNELQTTHVVLLEADERRSLAEAATADHEAVLANQALVRTADAAARASERRSETEQISVTQRNATTSRRKRHAPSRHAAQRPHRRNAATLTTRGCPCQSCGDAASRASALRGARSAQNAAKTKKKNSAAPSAVPPRPPPRRRAARASLVASRAATPSCNTSRLQPQLARVAARPPARRNAVFWRSEILHGASERRRGATNDDDGA